MSYTNWQQDLAKYYMTVLDGESKCEEIRKELASTNKFNPNSLFEYLDTDNKQFLSLNDFRSFLSEAGITYSETNLRRLIHLYDKNNDFAINADEYYQIITPRSSEELRNGVLDQRNSEVSEAVSQEVLETFSKLILQELDIVEVSSDLAHTINTSKDFTTYEGFLAIDTTKQNYILVKNLQNFLQKNGFELNNEQVENLIFRLDKDGDGKVSYDEFQEIFFPSSVGRSNLKMSQGSNLGSQPTNASSTSFFKSGKNFNKSIKVEENIDLSQNPLRSTYKTGFGSQNNFYKEETLNSPKEEKINSNKLQQSHTQGRSKEKFYSTLSTINKEPMSPLKSSINDEINVRASMNSYTSPKRFNERSFQGNRRSESVSLNYSQSKRYISPERKGGLTIPRKSPPRNTYYSPVRTAGLTRSLGRSYLSPSFNRKDEMAKLKSTNLAKFFHDLINIDIETESLRESLALKSEVNLQDLFALFDISRRDSLTIIDFKEVLKEFDIYSTIDRLKLVYKTYDSNMDGRIEYEEFCDMICPRRIEYSQLLRSRYPPEYFVQLSYEARKNLNMLLRNLIEGEQIAEEKKQLLNASIGFSSYESFEMLKGRYKSFVLKEDLYHFMRENSYYVNNFEIEVLFSRIDKSKDGKITFNEFIHEIIPKYNYSI